MNKRGSTSPTGLDVIKKKIGYRDPYDRVTRCSSKKVPDDSATFAGGVTTYINSNGSAKCWGSDNTHNVRQLSPEIPDSPILRRISSLSSGSIELGQRARQLAAQAQRSPLSMNASPSLRPYLGSS
uniref:Uncharacterized protein n=1 Tax=Globodera rostochiensis TaxID=31243 RepID=A0A914HSM0_GLORO